MAAIAAETSLSDNVGLEAMAASMTELQASVSGAIARHSLNLADKRGDAADQAFGSGNGEMPSRHATFLPSQNDFSP